MLSLFARYTSSLYLLITGCRSSSRAFFIEANERITWDGSDIASIVVLQAEDEISAISSAIGAAHEPSVKSHCGFIVRPVTLTSKPM
jgi:hypothetical protein